MFTFAKIFFSQAYLIWAPKLDAPKIGQSVLFDKVAALQTVALTQVRLTHMCFPMTFTKFLRRSILKKIPKELLL